MSSNTPFILGMAGGSGSGKSTLAQILQKQFGESNVQIVGQDHYYHDWEILKHKCTDVNFDHPEALDFGLLAAHLKQLKAGRQVEIPLYDFCTNRRLNNSELRTPVQLVIVDGTMIFGDREVSSQFDLKVFIDIPEEVRFQRRLDRDIRERGRTLESVRKQFDEQVAPMHNLFVESTKKHADMLIQMDNFRKQCLELIDRLDRSLFLSKRSDAIDTFSTL